MVDLAGYGELLNWLNVLFWGVGATLAYFAWTRPKSKGMKVAATLLVAVMFLTPTAMRVYSLTVYKMRYAKAKALFEERCKTAGERIHKTFSGVDVIRLLKIRSKSINFANQYVLDDPYGRDVGEDGYISSFMRVKGESQKSGYPWIEVVQADGSILRYRLTQKISKGGNPYTELQTISDEGPSAQFAVSYEDISTSVDRDHWIAGGRLFVVNIDTSEVIAERVGYIFDHGLGNTAGGRGPWEAADACDGADRKYGHNARFVLRVLKPRIGE